MFMLSHQFPNLEMNILQNVNVYIIFTKLSSKHTILVLGCCLHLQISLLTVLQRPSYNLYTVVVKM